MVKFSNMNISSAYSFFGQCRSFFFRKKNKVAFNSIPSDLLLLIAKFLDLKGLGQASNVNKTWRKITSHPEVGLKVIHLAIQLISPEPLPTYTRKSRIGSSSRTSNLLYLGTFDNTKKLGLISISSDFKPDISSFFKKIEVSNSKYFIFQEKSIQNKTCFTRIVALMCNCNLIDFQKTGIELINFSPDLTTEQKRFLGIIEKTINRRCTVLASRYLRDAFRVGINDIFRPSKSIR